MSICIYKNKCNPAASAANMHYITRDSAADSISFHNLDELQIDDKTQAKSNAIDYAEQREIEEECRVIGNERGTPRNHNRMVVSWDRKEETATAKEEIHQFLEKEFPNQRAVISIHQDSDHTHAHIWMDIRDIDTDRKTQLEPKKYRTLDERWARQYDEKYKTNYEREYKEKKTETREWKREHAQLKKEGKQPRPESKPARANDDKKRILQSKEIKDYGLEKSADRENKQLVTAGHSDVEKTKRTLEERTGRGEQADRAADAAIREANQVSKTVEQLPEREFRDLTSRDYGIRK
jgi:hypothetical protein